MAKEVITINEPNEICKDFVVGTLLNVNGTLLKVVQDDDDPAQPKPCDVCALDTEVLKEFCPCARCSDIHFLEIKDHE